jgi:hypothetical protein
VVAHTHAPDERLKSVQSADAAGIHSHGVLERLALSEKAADVEAVLNKQTTRNVKSMDTGRRMIEPLRDFCRGDTLSANPRPGRESL